MLCSPSKFALGGSLKKFIILIILFLSVSFAHSAVLQGVEAVVNDDVITTFELQIFLKPLYIKYSIFFDNFLYCSIYEHYIVQNLNNER